jgi:hypothetical protein
VLRSRPLALVAPGINPVLDLLVRNAIATIERRHGSLDAGDLPFVHVEILIERFGGEKRARAPVLLASFSKRFLTCGSTRTVKVVDGMVSILCIWMCTW